MTLDRRAGAPRLIEWTGERCVPWAPDVQVVYEHMHRYLWAAQLVDGKRVLDLGSGEGFGAAILAERANAVVGVDIDERTVEHARLNWSSPTVSFEVGSALDLSAFETDSFDVVVAFEIVEHLSDQGRMLAEVERVLSSDGLLIISTPDRRLYSEASGQENPFHERELTYEEFSALLGETFAHKAVWGQRTITGSHLGAIESGPVDSGSAQSEFFIERAGEEWRIAGEPAALYLVAVASNAALPNVPESSTLGDCGLELLRATERRGIEAANALLGGRDAATEQVHAATAEMRRREADFAEREVARDAQVRTLDAELAQRDEQIAYQVGELMRSRTRISEMEAGLVDAHGQLEHARRFTSEVEASITWQTFQKVRGRLFVSLGGERSLPARALRLGLRFAGRLMARRGTQLAPAASQAAAPMGERIVFPQFARPRVSLVIPLYSGAGLTRRALETIRDHTDGVAFEVILVDDTADLDTKGLLGLVDGARILHNEENEGYLRSVNRGAASARGEWLVLCNNDIEATPGWLESLLLGADSMDRVGVVAPKFLAPDGLLSEAGGILWNDGTGVNYGRGDEPSRPQYEYTREIDYGSAAALMVRKELWQDVGGYDERFVPMYYEDADLCFEARQRGWRVLYEPDSVVVHAEGSTAGTDINTGHKRHQEINRVKFVAKWRELLAAEHLRPGRQRRVEEAARRHRGPQVLAVDFRTPMWDRDAGSLRMFEIICSLQRLGYAVTFAPDNAARLEPYTRKLQRLGVEVIYGSIDVMPVLEEIGPSLTAAILSRPHPASRWLDSVREFAPAAVVAYDTVDLHWVRESRRFALGQTEPPPSDGKIVAQGPKAAALFELELAMVRACDLTISVTAEERAQILSDVPNANVVVIPTIHEVAESVPAAAGRRDILFVGSFEHPPNSDAVKYLVREVMPHVWQRRPDIAVSIVGGSASQEVEDLASSRVEIRGWVEDLDSVMRSARAMVVPVRFGAGVKGKITQGLAAGVPVVTTCVGAEGLDGEDGENMLIADDAEALADRIVRVIEDDTLWSSLSHGGRELIASKCSPAVLDERLRDVLSGARPRLAGDPGRSAAGRSA
ncbi:MAG TPA: glycosyltransferase [Solirubrobacteraceae bacterium]|jgi:GT2 family glycosyltransferase/SAM-dependent methyltransferase|nr:glycosyltransferase [Solirubrobacteraceae bacterium]